MLTELAKGRTVDTQWTWQVTGLLAVSLCGQLACGYLAMRFCWYASFEIARELRIALLHQLRRLPQGFHLLQRRGDIMSVATGDVQMIESFFSDGLPRLAQALGLPLVLFVFLMFRSPALAFGYSVSLIVAAPVFVWSSRALATMAIQRQDRQADAAEQMIEYARGMPVIRAFNHTTLGQRRFDTALRAFRDISIEMVSRLAMPMVAFGAIVMLGVPVLMVVGGSLYLSGNLSRGDTIAALVLALSCYLPILGLVTVMELVRLADASLTRIRRVMEAQPLRLIRDVAKPAGTALRFHEVGFSYDGYQNVLSHVSFEVPERSMTAIVGVSGAGKSTLLHLIPRFFDVTEGAITIGGADIRALSEEEIAGLVTFVFQDAYLFSGTIAENIALGKAGAPLAEIEQAARKAQAHEFIAALPNGYDTFVGEGGSTLSGGERQRVSIARALLKDAPIVLLDEATSAVDPLTEHDLQKALAALVASKTVVVVAHKLATIRNADQIIVLEQGRLIESGTDGALRTSGGRYCSLLQSLENTAKFKLKRREI
ncbi:ABC transporter ATP-binding protein [Mesorhizobium amorphae]